VRSFALLSSAVAEMLIYELAEVRRIVLLKMCLDAEIVIFQYKVPDDAD
jgi:hypothetical protein